MPGDKIDLQALETQEDFIGGTVTRRGLGRVMVEHILSQASQQIQRHVGDVVRVGARCAANDGDTALGVGVRRVRRQVQVEQLVAKGAIIR